jgi:hypothetical protein
MNRVLAALAYRKRGPDFRASNDPASLIDSAVQTLVAGAAVPIDAVTMSQPVSSPAQGEAFMRAVEDAASEHHLVVDATVSYGRVRVRLSPQTDPQKARHGEA